MKRRRDPRGLFAAFEGGRKSGPRRALLGAALAFFSSSACVDTVPSQPESPCEGSACEEGTVCQDGGCLELESCAQDPCHPLATCANTEDGFECTCPPGFSGDGRSCEAEDACVAGQDDCGPNARCTGEPGALSCRCEPGFSSDGQSCVDIDECATSSDDCSVNATCTNSEGSFSCACNPGFTGDGRVCREIVCPDGFRLEDGSCVDVDECATGQHACDARATCTNAEGSFSCACNPGFSGDGTTCVDIDECSGGTAGCSPNAICTNFPGRFECRCDNGYTGDGFTCDDVNECTEDPSPCDEQATCENRTGDFACTCNPGFTGDGRSCTDIDECGALTDNCDENATCTNSPGAFSCTCNQGYAGSGTSCEDVNECTNGQANCDENATCDNTPGGFLCTCLPGFEGNGVSCRREGSCQQNDCDINATCTDNPGGGFSCACDEGYDGDGRACTPRFNIELVFQDEPSPAVRAAFESAEARWENLITGDLPDVTLSPSDRVVCGVPEDISTIDDLLIDVDIAPIDGLNGVLGQAGPRCFRGAGPGQTTVSGVMRFDSVDVQSLIANGTFEAVVLHEMAHVIGLGSTAWTALDLIENASCPNGSAIGNREDTRYVGAEAVTAWQALGGTGTVPVENAAGQGSCDSHWREDSALGEELMSPSLSTINALSTVTLRSLVDLGYQVGPDDRADTFLLGPSLRAEEGATALMHDCVLLGPLYALVPNEPARRLR